MSIQHVDPQADRRVNHEVEEMAQALGLAPQSHHAEACFDPVEAYFECITTCSLDDGECITTCTELLREQV